jgi:hypothetical protein
VAKVRKFAPLCARQPNLKLIQIVPQIPRTFAPAKQKHFALYDFESVDLSRHIDTSMSSTSVTSFIGLSNWATQTSASSIDQINRELIGHGVSHLHVGVAG